MAGVIIYTAKGCPFCSKAKSFLDERGIGYEEVVAPVGSRSWNQMRKITGSGSLPQVLVGGKPVGGYADLAHLEATGALGQMLGLAPGEALSPVYDVIIIGGGPAGLSAAVYTARKVLKTLVISKDVGGQVAWTYDVDNYLGFSQVETADLIMKFEEHVEKYGVEKVVGVKVKALDVTGKTKKVIVEDGTVYLAKTIILATGKRPKHLGVPGERELLGMGVTYCSTCDAPLFAGLDVAVAGGGNSALEAVLDLAKVARKVYLISATPITGDEVLKDKMGALPQVKIFTEHEILRITGESAVEAIEVAPAGKGAVERLEVSGIIVEIGLLPNSDLVLDVAETNAVGEVVIDARCRTGIAGLFACGDVTDVPFKQVIVAAGEGAKAALSAYDYIINQR
jgi:alkyl hydroperoxide reductase subunit F